MEITKEQIAVWKKSHPIIYKISVDGHSCYLKPPTRQTLSFATMAAKESPLKFNEVILEHCWLGGDDIIKTDDTLFLSIGEQIAKMVEIKDATLEKL